MTSATHAEVAALLERAHRIGSDPAIPTTRAATPRPRPPAPTR
ncbi:hypothetical protein NKH18_50800 [Streptomyces sp. M10(2022)]